MWKQGYYVFIHFLELIGCITTTTTQYLPFLFSTHHFKNSPKLCPKRKPIIQCTKMCDRALSPCIIQMRSLVEPMQAGHNIISWNVGSSGKRQVRTTPSPPFSFSSQHWKRCEYPKSTTYIYLYKHLLDSNQIRILTICYVINIQRNLNFKPKEIVRPKTDQCNFILQRF